MVIQRKKIRNGEEACKDKRNPKIWELYGA